MMVAISRLASDGERVLHLSSRYDEQTMNLSIGESQIQLRLPYLGLMNRTGSLKLRAR
jgi:hypothetical protein